MENLKPRGQNVLKLIIIFLASVISYKYACAQTKVFILDEDSIQSRNSDFKILHYKLSTSDIYGIDSTVDIFNLIPASNRHKNELILFAALPDVDSANWEQIDFNDVTPIDFKELLKLKDQVLGLTGISPYFTRYFNQYKLGIKKDSKLKIAKNCLLQFFAIRNYPMELNRPLGTIDTTQPTIPIQQFRQNYNTIYPDDNFPLEIGEYTLNFEPFRMKREYLSKSFDLRGNTAYQFWTLYDWSTRDNYETERGIDRFVYIPNKGIVGGSFDFYFLFNAEKFKIPISRFRKNILEEKVMIAEELR